MARREANQAVQSSMLSGFQHHDPELANRVLTGVLTKSADEEEIRRLLPQFIPYAEMLAPNRLRAQKNGFIAMITVVCRAAIHLGLDIEESYSLSDYYLCEIENCADKRAVYDLSLEALKHYADRVQAAESGLHSRPINRAIRYIRANLYEPCKVQEVANYVHLNPEYFSSLFKKEVGMSPARYIRTKKLEEGCKLLLQGENTASDIAEILGFSSASHFARAFREEYGITPKKYAMNTIASAVTTV